MPPPRFDLGIARSVRAEALGEPGKRTFRLLVEAERGTAVVWLEKEQLSSLAASIKSYLESLEKKGRERPEAREATNHPAFEFKATTLALTYDEEHGTFGVLAYDEEDAAADRPTVVWYSPRTQAGRMAEQALEVVAAGRPTCPLCHRPMGPEVHVCPHHNGHQPVEGRF